MSLARPLPAPPTGVPFVHRFYGPAWRQALDTGSRRLPRLVRQALVPLFAGGLLPFLPELRRGIAANLERVLGPAGPLETWLRIFRVMRCFGIVMTDAHAVQAGGPLPMPVAIHGKQHLDGCQDGGAILGTAHLGPWPLGGELLSREGRRVTVVMAEEANADTERLAASRREGRYSVVHSGGPAEGTLALLSALRRGELVAMQIDRCPARSRASRLDAERLPVTEARSDAVVELPFFGAPARFPSGPLLLGRASGAPLIPCFFALRPPGCAVHIEAPFVVPRTLDREADLRGAGLRLVALLERHVRAYPFQWFAFRDFWSEGP
jgi:KDO2-lipid IV(A) lauroyltransferase